MKKKADSKMKSIPSGAANSTVGGSSKTMIRGKSCTCGSECNCSHK